MQDPGPAIALVASVLAKALREGGVFDDDGKPRRGTSSAELESPGSGKVNHGNDTTASAAATATGTCLLESQHVGSAGASGHLATAVAHFPPLLCMRSFPPTGVRIANIRTHKCRSSLRH